MCSVWAENKHSSAVELQNWNLLVFVHLLSSFGGVISDNKVWAAHRSTWLLTVLWIISRVDSECAQVQYLTCTIILLSDNVILSYIQSLGVNQRFLFGLKVVLIPVAAALPASWLRKMPNPTYCPKSRYSTKAGSLKLYLQWNFLSRVWDWGRMTSEVRLQKMLWRQVGCCPWWSLMP